jgi:hypothetical protein
MKVIAFGHQKDVGKDTAARFVMTHLRTNSRVRKVEKRGFADKLKDVCFQLYSWAGLMPGSWYEESAERRKLKEVVLPALGKSPRQIWIAFGNEVKNAAYRDTWLQYLFQSVKCDFLIISDLRFPNEAEFIQANGGRVVKVVRPSVAHTSDAADDPLLAFAGWDHIITNDSDLTGFYQQVSRYVEEMLR